MIQQDQSWGLQTVHIYFLCALGADLQRPALLLLDKAVPGLHLLCHHVALGGLCSAILLFFWVSSLTGA